MDKPESNSSPLSNESDEIETPDEKENKLETNEEKIAWLTNQVETLSAALAALESRLTEIAAMPIPTPETVAEWATQVMEPETNAIREMLTELRESQHSIQTKPNPDATVTSPMEPPVVSPDESPVVEPVQPQVASQIPERQTRRVVKV